MIAGGAVRTCDIRHGVVDRRSCEDSNTSKELGILMEKVMVEPRHIPLTSQSTTPSDKRSTSITDVDARKVHGVAVGKEDTAPTKDGEKGRWHPGYYLHKMAAGESSSPTSSLSSFEEFPVEIATTTDVGKDTCHKPTEAGDGLSNWCIAKSLKEEELKAKIEQLQKIKTLSKYHEDDQYMLVFERSDSISSDEASSCSEDSNNSSESGEERSLSTVSSLSLVSCAFSDDGVDGDGYDDNRILADSQKKCQVVFQDNQNQSKKSASSILPTDTDPTSSSVESLSFLSMIMQALVVGVTARNGNSEFEKSSKRQRVMLAKLVSQDLCSRPTALVVPPPPASPSRSPPSSPPRTPDRLVKVSQPSSPGSGTATTTASTCTDSTGGGTAAVHDVTSRTLPQRVTQDSLLTKHALLALHGKNKKDKSDISDQQQEETKKKTIVQTCQNQKLEIPDLSVERSNGNRNNHSTILTASATSVSQEIYHKKKRKNIRLPSSGGNDIVIEAFYATN